MANLPKWTLRPDVISYIIDAYAGTDEVPDSKRKRRVFIWEDGDEIKMGNCEAFAIHLEAKFELIRVQPSDLHAMLRELGEVVQAHKPHAPKTAREVKYVPPEPDEWVIGVVKGPPTTDQGA